MNRTRTVQTLIDRRNKVEPGSTLQSDVDQVRQEIQGRQRNQSPFMLVSGYEAANNSPSRGYVYWPGYSNDRSALSGIADAEIRRRVKWLYANFGMARRIVRGLAKLLGIQTPQPITPDDDWNELVFDHFLATAGSPFFYDRKARFDFFTAQPVINRHRFKEGRCFGAFTDTPSGGARMVFYEAGQLKKDPKRENEKEIWVGGTHLDEFDRPIGYGLQDARDGSRYSYVPAGNGIYYSNWDSFGAIEGISVLAHAVANMVDVVELRGLRKHAAKNAAQLGTVIEKDRAAVTSGTGGLGGPLITQEVDLGDGTTQEVKWELMTGQGVVPRLDPGEKIRLVADDRPTQNNLDFDRALLEDCILGVDLPPSALYYVAGLTGPAVRFNMEDIRRWVLIEQRPQALANQRYYAVWLAKEIRKGRIPRYPGVPWWRQVQWIGQPDMTIDRGRDGQLAITRLDAGLTTWGDEYALSGFYGRRKLREKVIETAWLKREIATQSNAYGVDLTLGEVVPRLSGKADQVVDDRLTAIEQRNQAKDDQTDDQGDDEKGE
jgi:hypothetical protein